ncbi:MAG TPA: hypothetical protein VGJ57_02015 [Nitrospirales bacterium]|jgi:hypothetical protein
MVGESACRSKTLSVDPQNDLCNKANRAVGVCDGNMMKNAGIILWLFYGLTALGVAGCQHQTPASEQQYRQEVRFRGAWDYAIGRLSYDEVLESWGPPTSLLSGYSPQGGTLDSAPILANWHWNHSLPDIAPHFPDGSLRFGEQMELVFDRETKRLIDWKYWAWGPTSLLYRHEDSQKAVLPTGGISITQ